MVDQKSNPLEDKLRTEHFLGLGKDVPRIVSLQLVELSPNPYQPRKEFSKNALKELAESIEQHGLISPIAIQRAEGGEGYIIVAGERRFRAHEMLGRDTITAIITTGDPQELAVIENLQRENLSPLEEAEAYLALKERFQYTDKDVAHVEHSRQHGAHSGQDRPQIRVRYSETA